MKDQSQKLMAILKHFQGMNKIDAFAIIHKLEVLLYYIPNPVNTTNLKPDAILSEINEKDIDPFHFSTLPNGNPCEFIAQNEWMQIYKETTKFRIGLKLFNPYYFKTKYTPLQLKKLTKKNIINDLKGKPEEIKLIKFLETNSITKKDAISNEFLVLSL